MENLAHQTKIFQSKIGLEVHVQIDTPNKLFSAASTDAIEPNSAICPFDIGIPGTLPIVNQNCVDQAIKAALVFACSVQNKSMFERKHYFYPDLPSGYQITQSKMPFAIGGKISIPGKSIRIHHIHMEQDAGKSIHDLSKIYSYVDYNRSGVGLLEIVTEPDIVSGEEAAECIKYIINSLRYVGVSDCCMAEGKLRADVNISMYNDDLVGNRVEIKNLNSIEAIRDAVKYELARHLSILSKGNNVERETRGFNGKETVSMRKKEYAFDYMHMKDPDLPYLIISDSRVAEISKSMPELYSEKKERFINQYQLSDYDAAWLTHDLKFANYYEAVINQYKDQYNEYDLELAKMIANWVMTEIARYQEHMQKIWPARLAQILHMIRKNLISNNMGRELLTIVIEKDTNPREIADAMGLVQINDEDAIRKIVSEVISRSEEQVAAYKSGRTRMLAYFVGEVMKATKGKAQPKLTNEIIKESLDKI